MCSSSSHPSCSGGFSGIINNSWGGSGSPSAGALSIDFSGLAIGANPGTLPEVNSIILIHQTQHATIFSNDDPTYGDGESATSFGAGMADPRRTGQFEYNTVLAVSGNTITLEDPLQSPYFSSSPNESWTITSVRPASFSVSISRLSPLVHVLSLSLSLSPHSSLVPPHPPLTGL